MRSNLGYVMISSLSFFALAACGSSSDTTAPAADAGGTETTGVQVDDAGAPDAVAPIVVDAAPPVVDAGSDVDNGSASDTYPAPHPALPTVVTEGGAVLKTPIIQPIFYTGHTFQTQVVDLVTTLGATDYWTAATAEYGVGPATGLPAIVLTGETAPATITSDAVDTWVAAELAAGKFGALDSSKIYAIFYPSTTAITTPSQSGGVDKSCDAFGGYHSNVTVAGKNYAYAVLPQCSHFSQLQGIDALSAATSHELIEAATDPFPQHSPTGYSSVDIDDLVWTFALGGGEVSDMCAQNEDAWFKPEGYAYTVQRSWSNVAAKKSQTPCVPVDPTTPYFGAAPVLSDISVNVGQVIKTKGIQVKVGETKTVEVDLFSDRKTAPFDVFVGDVSGAQNGQGPVTYSLDRKSGVNGEKLQLTITTTKAADQGATAFILVAHLDNQVFYWPGLVVTQ